MRNYTVREVQIMVDRATEDVFTLERLLSVLNHVPVKLSEHEHYFLCRNFKVPDGKDKFVHWREKLEECLKNAKESIPRNKKWIQDRLTKPHRCALPKKKQRELGLLPPI